jgi:hypothetical protein
MKTRLKEPAMPHIEHLRPSNPRVQRPPLPRMRLPPLAEIGFIGLRVVIAVTVAMAAYATLHGMRA